jgi:hypothetical protein
MYNLIEKPELKTDDIKFNLLEDGGLCPSCEKRIANDSMLASFTNDNGVYYYLVCTKCLNLLNKVDDVLRNKRKFLIEERLNNNIHIYSALLMKNESFLSDEEKMVSVLNDNDAPWILEDKEYFLNNPARKFRCRKIFFGELEETYQSKKHLKDDARDKNIQFVIVHYLGNGQTIKSFINDISNKYPIEEENFIAALFIILINKINPDKIMDIYKDINERKKIFDGLDSLKVNY